MDDRGRSNEENGSLDTLGEVFRFASFELLPSRRLLLDSGNLVALGSRAFDLLALLVLQARLGDVPAALATLGAALEKMPPGSFVMYHTRFLGEHAYLLSCVGDFAQSAKEIDTALQLSEELDERWFLAEVLRLKGKIVLKARPDGGADLAEALFHQSLSLAKQQGARSLELRTATSIARLYTEQGRRKEGHDLLQAVYAWFTEGFHTADLQAAKAVLDA